MLTKTQINRIQKALSQHEGLDVKLLKSQIQYMVKTGGLLLTSLMSLATPALPYATKMASKVLPGLAQGALTSLGNFSMDKILKGGFLIEPDKIKHLAPVIGLLTKKQIEDIQKAINLGQQLVIKPTKKQQDRGALGTILASIGVPLLLNAIGGKGLQNGRSPLKSNGRGLQNRRPPSKSEGNGLQNRRPPKPKGGSVNSRAKF